MSNKVVACGALFGMEFVTFFYLLFFFLNLCMGYRMWGSIWGGISPIFFFFSKFVCGPLLSQFFFFFKLFLSYEIEAF
jgi:hypothetical protein